MNFEIKTYYYSEKRFNVRKNLIPGSWKSLWKAVKIAKYIGSESLPCNMTFGNMNILEHERSVYFASFFEEKVRSVTDNVRVDDRVFNGTRKIDAESELFMGPDDVIKCIKPYTEKDNY